MTAQGYLSFPDARIIGVPNRISNSRKRGRFSHNAGTNVGVVRGVRVLEERDPGEASLSAEKKKNEERAILNWKKKYIIFGANQKNPRDLYLRCAS